MRSKVLIALLLIVTLSSCDPYTRGPHVCAWVGIDFVAAMSLFVTAVRAILKKKPHGASSVE